MCGPPAQNDHRPPMTTLRQALRELGKVLESEAERAPYSQDVSENPRGWPDLVVVPGSAGEVIELVRLADRDAVPITPVVAGYNVGGLAIPQAGGIVLDLKSLDRIVELDREAMYVVVEPGVTF